MIWWPTYKPNPVAEVYTKYIVFGGHCFEKPEAGDTILGDAVVTSNWASVVMVPNLFSYDRLM